PGGVLLALLGPVLGVRGAVCPPTGRRRPISPDLRPTRPAHLVLLRQPPGLLSVCATVPQRLAPGHPDSPLRRGPYTPAPPAAHGVGAIPARLCSSFNT